MKGLLIVCALHILNQPSCRTLVTSDVSTCAGLWARQVMCHFVSSFTDLCFRVTLIVLLGLVTVSFLLKGLPYGLSLVLVEGFIPLVPLMAKTLVTWFQIFL